MNNKVIIENGKPRISAVDLNFEEVDESKGTVEIPLENTKKEEPKYEGPVEHLSNDYDYASAYASSRPTQFEPESEPEVKSTKQPAYNEEQLNTQLNKPYNVYDDLDDNVFNYPFNNYTKLFIEGHTYTPKPDDAWEIVDFPSSCVFYDFDVIRCRPFKTRALAKLNMVIQNKDFTGLLDILNMYIDCDIRDLTRPDFKFFMFWLRVKSFPSSELVLEWTSRYGNRNKTIINGTTALDYLKMDKTREDVKKWAEKGYTYPRVRDLEYATVNELSDEDEWLFEYAKYYIGNTPEDKVEEFEKHTNSYASDIEEFKKLFEHGIEEYVYARDSQFNRDEYIKELTEKLGFMHEQEEKLSIKAHMTASELESYDYICQMIGIMEEELYKAKNNPNMIAEEEKIMLPFRSINLLPNIPLTDDSE